MFAVGQRDGLSRVSRELRGVRIIAIVLAGALHIVVATLLWREGPTSGVRAPAADQLLVGPPLFVEFFPSASYAEAKAQPQAAAGETTVMEPVIIAGETEAEAEARTQAPAQTEPQTRRQTQGRSQTGSPRSAQAAGVQAPPKPRHSPSARSERIPPSPSAPRPTDGNTGSSPTLRDYAWRPSDSIALDESRTRGNPAIRLSPKEKNERSTLARDMQKAARPPCRDVHASKGLLALPFLLAGSMMDDCKW